MDPQILQPGELIAGRLRVEKVLGAGGMGVVLAARHVELGELVAVKMLRLPSDDGRAFERLRREARAAAKLRGEHVVRVMDVGTLESGAPFIVMEYVAGQTLAQAREAAGRLPVSTAVDWVLQACEGLAEAHGIGIVHRDIKPSNLILTTRPDGSSLIKLLDFGIAKSAAVAPTTLTETGGFLGSPLYASPEQVRDARAVDHRTDIWSLGVVLYQLVTGQLPFPSYTASAALASLVADPPVAPRQVAPELPVALERVLLRCLEKDPQHRYATVAELARALSPFGSVAAEGATARVARILGQAGKQPSDSPPGAETLSTFAPSQDGSLAASRTASHVAARAAGDAQQPRRNKARWLLAAVAVVAAVAAVFGSWPRGDRSLAPVIERASPPLAALGSAPAAAGTSHVTSNHVVPAVAPLDETPRPRAVTERSATPPEAGPTTRPAPMPRAKRSGTPEAAAAGTAPAPTSRRAQVPVAPQDEEDFGPRK